MNILDTWEVLHQFKDFIFPIIYKLLGTEQKVMLWVKMNSLINCVILFITIQPSYIEANHAEGIIGCKASECNLERCHVDCDGLNLHFIPGSDMVPEAGFALFINLKILHISRNPLEHCENGSFMGLNSLTELYIRDVDPETGSLIFESSTFNPLTSLKLLDLSYSSIRMSTIFKAFCGLSDNIETILMDKIFTHHLIKNIDMPCFHRLKVKKISIDFSNIGQIASNFIFNIKSVEYSSLKLNRIDWFINYLFFSILHNLTYVDLSCQYLFSCDTKYPWSEWLPNVPRLYGDNWTIVTTKLSHASNHSKLYILLYIFPNLQTIILRNLFLDTRIKSKLFMPCWANNYLLNLDISFIIG